MVDAAIAISASDDIPQGWRRYVYAANHMDVGMMFLWFAGIAAIAGGGLSMVLQAELMEPGLQIVKNPPAYDVLATGHGLIMVYFVAIPALIGGFGNWLVPLMIGAPGTAFARLAALSFWLMPFAFLLLVMSLLADGAGGPGIGGGWTLNPPLSTAGSPGPAMDFGILALYLAAAAAILCCVNLITTILNMRGPGMTLYKMPLFVWSILIAAFVLLAILPVLLAALTMLLADRHFATSFFNPAGGGDPLLYQNLFWFFAHPGLTILIVPAFGLATHAVTALSERPVFGYRGMVFAMMAMGLIGFAAGACHLAAAGLSFDVRLMSMLAALALMVPATVLTGSLIATLWGGAIVFKTPMLFAIAFIVLFVAGALSGAVQANPGLAPLLHGTPYVTAHFHYAFAMATAFAVFAGFYFWFPKFFGVLYNETLARIHFWITFTGVNLAFFPMFFLGLSGMGRRVADYPDGYAPWNSVSAAGAFVAGAGVLVFLIVLAEAFAKKRKADDNPWGAGASTLEWTLPSPPPFRTFNELPKIT